MLFCLVHIIEQYIINSALSTVCSEHMLHATQESCPRPLTLMLINTALSSALQKRAQQSLEKHAAKTRLTEVERGLHEDRDMQSGLPSLSSSLSLSLSLSLSHSPFLSVKG